MPARKPKAGFERFTTIYRVQPQSGFVADANGSPS